MVIQPKVMYRFNIVPIKIAISDSYGSLEKQNKTTTATKNKTIVAKNNPKR